jgi:hypothetical protein
VGSFAARRGLIAAVIVTAWLVTASWGVAAASTSINIDDGCKTGTSNDGLFWAAGPASGWSVVHTTQYVAIGSCYLWTYQTAPGTPTINYSDWYLPTSSSYQGNYHFNVSIVNDHDAGAFNAVYRRWPKNTQLGFDQTYCVDQADQHGTQPLLYPPSTSYMYVNGINYAAYMQVVDGACGTSGPGGEHLAVDEFLYHAA